MKNVATEGTCLGIYIFGVLYEKELVIIWMWKSNFFLQFNFFFPVGLHVSLSDTNRKRKILLLKLNISVLLVI